VLALATAASLVLVACGSKQPTGTTLAGPSLSAAPVATFGVPSFGPPATESPDDSTPITIDSSLLAYLPTAIDATPVNEDLDVATDALSDPTLPKIASAVDTAVGVDTGTGNLVTAWVVKLRPGAFGDEVYRQWRDSYDEGACNAAGGIVGRAEATLGGRNTYVTSCVTALRTYHVWLQDQGILVSASSIGDGRYGEKLMSTLRVPGPGGSAGTSAGAAP
jgi:hypothetical protein